MKYPHLCLLLALTAAAAGTLRAQSDDDGSTTERTAHAAEGEYRAAAEGYAASYDKHPRRIELAYQAAEYFALARDYERAAAYYRPALASREDYPLAQLKLARAYRQTARYDSATAAFLEYLRHYDGPDSAIVFRTVEQEVRGTLMNQNPSRHLDLDRIVTPVGAGVNSPSGEFGPMPLTATTVYFLSDRLGLTRMFRSTQGADGRYGESEVAGQFPYVVGKNVGSGALGPEGDRFYFSLCEDTEQGAATAAATAPNARGCMVYLTEREGSSWGEPKPLPGYINAAGSTTGQPYVYEDGGKEILLFASNRDGGYGGMDLWRTERELGSTATDFSFPVNLGSDINGPADEVTPYYEPATGTLHFASNGGVTFGGFDIFEARASGPESWTDPENFSPPVNSIADDYYYRRTPGSPNALFASNRGVGGSEVGKSDDDLYEVRPGNPDVQVTLQVMDSALQVPLTEVTLTAFISLSATDRRPIAYEYADDGYFELALPAGQDVELEVQRLDYVGRLRRLTISADTRRGFQVPPIRLARVPEAFDPASLADAPPVGPLASPEALASGSPAPGSPANGEPLASVAAPGPIPPAEASPRTSATARTSPAARSEPADRAPQPTLASASPTPEELGEPTAGDGTTGNDTISIPATATVEATDALSAALALDTVASAPDSAALRVTVSTAPDSAAVTVTLDTIAAADGLVVAADGEPAPVDSTTSAPNEPAAGAPVVKVYRIQLEAARAFEPGSERYAVLREVGELSEVPMGRGGILRILIGEYDDPLRALHTLDLVRGEGWGDAFVAYFEDGEYMGPWVVGRSRSD